MVSRSLSEWLPDGPPSRGDVVLAALAVASLVLNFSSIPRVSWGWAAAGVLAFAVGAGPGAKSAVGRRVSRWFENVGLAGRGAAILLYVVGFWVTEVTVGVPRAPALSFAVGVVLGVPAFVLLRAIHARRVGGGRT